MVVISLVGGDALAECIERLPTAEIECAVVLCGEEKLEQWRRRYPGVRFLPAGREPVPLRRRRGVQATSGPIVGVIEDTSFPDQRWVAAVATTFANAEVAAATGPVSIAGSLSGRCKALALVEFGPFLPPNKPVNRVAGNNMAFRRAPLMVALAGSEGIFEGPVCARLTAAGSTVAFAPDMAVTYAACRPDAATVGSRFHHGRLYGSTRVAGRSATIRALAVARASLLPVVLTARAAHRLAGSAVRGNLLATLFWVFLFESAWALGEAAGAVAGAGNSLKAWQ